MNPKPDIVLTGRVTSYPAPKVIRLGYSPIVNDRLASRPMNPRLPHPLVVAAAALVACIVCPNLGWADDATVGEPAAEKKKPTGPVVKKRKKGVHVASLRRCLFYADRNHPKVLQARSQLTYVRAQLLEARFAPFSGFRFFGGVGLAPTVLGNNVFSPNTDASLTSNLGVAWRAGIDGALPLWTFGKITNLWDAAKAQVKLKEANIEVTRDQIRLDVRKAFFGLQLARDSLHLLADAEEKINKAIKELKKKPEDELDPIDLLKLQTYSAELEARHSEAERYERIALTGLRFYTGKARLDIPDKPIRRSKHKLGHLSRYLKAARRYRPEFKMARAGIAAREAQVRLARSNLFPDLGLALSIGLSAAPEVADQINPFVGDPGNYFHYGFAIVTQWGLDFVPKVARIKQAQAQLDEVMAKDREALGGIAAKVETAYAEVVDWQKRYDAYHRANKFAKKWLATVQSSIDIGMMEEKDLIEPAKAYAEQRYNKLKAIMELNVAMSKLARETGWDGIAPDGT